MSGYLSHFFCVGIPAVLIFTCFGPYRRRALVAQNLHSSRLREIALHLFVLCLFGLTAMVLWPGYHIESSDGLWGNLVIHTGRKSWRDNINLIPFRMVTGYLLAFQAGMFFYAIVQFIGNIVTFLPLGFFPALLFRNFGAGKTFRFGLFFSLSVECCQFFLGRHSDVDDVMLNVLGVMLGFSLCQIAKRLFPGIMDKFSLR